MWWISFHSFEVWSGNCILWGFHVFPDIYQLLRLVLKDNGLNIDPKPSLTIHLEWICQNKDFINSENVPETLLSSAGILFFIQWVQHLVSSTCIMFVIWLSYSPSLPFHALRWKQMTCMPNQIGPMRADELSKDLLIYFTNLSSSPGISVLDHILGQWKYGSWSWWWMKMNIAREWCCLIPYCCYSSLHQFPTLTKYWESR